jgi:hypothetical protein
MIGVMVTMHSGAHMKLQQLKGEAFFHVLHWDVAERQVWLVHPQGRRRYL